MANPAFENIGACVFDAYGTLFDFNAAANRFRDDLGGKADKLNEIWRMKQLQYTWLRSLMEAHVDFWTLTGEALDYALEAVDINDPALRDRLMKAYLTLDAYPEVPSLLKALQARGIKTAILSNGEPKMLKAALDGAGLSDLLDTTLSVEEAGIYKPHSSTYQLAVDRLGVPANRISFQSANSWDAAGAAHFGFRVVWCNRFGQGRDHLPGQPDAEITSLDQLLPIVGAA